MQHSIVARHASWPARYVHSTTRNRERRLGLHAGPVFTAAPSRRTVLQRPDVGPLTALRAPWRALVVASPRPATSGLLRPAAAMSWTSSDRGGSPRRSSLATAWRA